MTSVLVISNLRYEPHCAALTVHGAELLCWLEEPQAPVLLDIEIRCLSFIHVMDIHEVSEQ